MKNRYDFIYLFDVKDANPNGDPDAGNLPRVDAETGHGLITDVCLKRKVRNFVALTKPDDQGKDQDGDDAAGYDIYVKEKAVLNLQHGRAYKKYNIKPESKKLPKDLEDAKKVTGFMCRNFYDIRTFGAVMTTDVNCGQVRGPVQLAFSRSVDPIISSEHAVTRCAVTTEKEAADQSGDNRTMGRKFTVPYALYRCQGAINPFLAEQTGFSEGDLELFLTALEKAFDFDASAARPAGSMAARKLVVFKHATALGNAPAHKLFEAVTIHRQNDSKPPRAFSDYGVTIDGSAIPDGVEVIERI